jgi:hypothetical protein
MQLWIQIKEAAREVHSTPDMDTKNAFFKTTYLHLVLRSRMYGDIPPIPQYTFMVWYLVKKKAHGQLYL